MVRKCLELNSDRFAEQILLIQEQSPATDGSIFLSLAYRSHIMNIRYNQFLQSGPSRSCIRFGRFLIAMAVFSWVGSLHAATFNGFPDDPSTVLNSVTTGGPYDGIWVVTSAGYVAYMTINENAGSIIAVLHAPDTSYWEAYSGPRNGNTGQFSSILGNVTANGTVTFTSPTSLTGRVNSCVPIVIGWQCGLTSGATFQGTKIW